MSDKPTEPISIDTLDDKVLDSIALDEKTDKASTDHTADKQNVKKQGNRWPAFILAFVIGSITSVFAWQYYEVAYSPHSSIALTQPIAVKSTPKPPQIAAHQKEIIVEKTAIKDAAAKLVDTPSNTVPSNTVLPNILSNKDGEALLQAVTALQSNIQALQGELQALRQQQSDITRSQTQLESMQLHTRLSWIIKHNSHLPQMKLAWQEISLLPSLTAEQRTLAESMLLLAQQRQDDVWQWQQQLEHLIVSLKLDEHHNIIPEKFSADASNPWLQWLLEQFSFKRSQCGEQLALLALKNKLLSVKQAMDLEQWPTTADWTRLRAQLQLHLLELNDGQGDKHSEQTKDQQAVNLRLPENFQAIQTDVEQLRQAARLWLEE